MDTIILVENETKVMSAFDGALLAWADQTTNPTSKRRADLLHDKTRAALDFFGWCGKPADQVKPADVKSWQAELESRRLAPATVYAMVSRVSSFYRWLEKLGDERIKNPAELARPKPPIPYQTESTKSLSDAEIKSLLAVVKSKANIGDFSALRDYALLIFYLLTGLRREEVIDLTWGDLHFEGEALTISYRQKGGELVNREVNAAEVWQALYSYLRTTNRLDNMQPDSPLWLRHDRAGDGQSLSSHGFAGNLKRYGREAGINSIHVHQTRHTFARIVAEESGSLTDCQEALGHKNLQTTRVYVARIGLRRDKYGAAIGERLCKNDTNKAVELAFV